MKKQILLALFLSFTYLGLNAQCNIPFPPATTCAGAPVICDLDGYCTTSAGGNATDQPTTFCGSVQNNQWFAFVAGSQNITLDFIVALCGGTTSGTGLQAQVYSVCGAPWTAASNCLYEISPNSTGTLTMAGLTVGNVYYLMTDGFSGDICDYSIEVTSGSTTPPTPDPAGAISGDAQFCPGASSVTYCAAASAFAAFYEWTIPVGATIVGADDGACITIDFSGIVGTTGVITATPTNGCESGAPSTFNVSQGPAPSTPDVDFVLCPGDTEVYGNTVYSSAGSFLNTDIANAQGCLIETMVNVVVGQDVVTGLMETICGGETSTTGETSTGMYTYNLFTSLGCDSTVSLDLTVLNPQTGIFPVTDEIDCLGTPIEVDAVVTDFDPSIEYIWTGPCFNQNFTTDPTIQVSCGGTYTVFAQQTVNGVVCVSPVSSVEVIENTTPPTADPGLGGVIDCGTSTFSLGDPGSSNTGTYSYSWTDPNGFSSAIQFPDATEPGTYCFFMVDAATNCISSTECVTVTGDNTPPVAAAAASNNLDCSPTNSTATLDPTGSDAGTYTWTVPSGSLSGSNPSVGEPGTYTLTVSSGNGCTNTAQVTITEDIAAPTASVANPAAIDCNNTTASLDGSGSSGGVTYLWSTGETTPTATTNMGAGTYTLTVTNTTNGCTDEMSVVVNDNTTVVTADIDVSGQITCTSGSVTLSAINITGSSNPSYSWSTGGTSATTTVASAGLVTLTITDQTTGCTADFTANVTSDNNTPMAVAGVSGLIDCNNQSVVLSTAGSSTGGNITASWSTATPNMVTTAGTYTLTITNTDNGCTATADVTVVEDTTTPVAAIAVPTAIDCNNTSTTLDGSGSTGANLSYAWTGQGTGASSTLNAASAGTYILTVTNMDNGCTDTEEVTVVDNTTTVTVTASVSNELTCTQTTTTLDVSGGSGSSSPTYTWTGPGTITGSGPTVSVNTAGIYTLTLIDSNTGCEGSTTVTVIEDASGPTASVAAADDLTCTTGSVTLDGTASSAGNNITYQWFNGTTEVTSATTAIIDVTVAGDYTLVVTDVDNGCTTTSAVVPVILDDAAPTASAVAGSNGILSCSSSSLTIDGSSSTGSGSCLTYEWTNNGSVVGAAATLEVSNAGDYILVVTNCDNGCTNETTVTVAADAGLPTVTIEPVVNLDCNNSTSTLQGTGTSNTGGTVSVEWFFGTTSVGVNPDVTTMDEGEYTFVVTDDGNGCSSSATVQLIQNIDPPVIDIATAPIIDCNNQMVTVNASGSASGTNITYQWQDATMADLPLETSNTLVTSIAGDYTLVVTNTDNGCTSTQLVNVPENIEAPVFDASALNNIDCDNMEASLTSSITSSFSTDLSYQWILGGTTLDTNPTFATANEGEITVIVTDNANGCTSQMNVTVLNTTETPTIAASASSNGALNCTTLESILDGTGTDEGANFNYTWTLDTDPANVLGTDLMYTTEVPGTYILTVTNTDNGCGNTIPVTVTQSIAEPTSVAISNTATLTCTDPTITLDGSSSSIGASFTYQWFEVVGGVSTEIPMATDISYDAGVAGTYELVVTNTDNGCTQVSTQLVIDQSSDVPMAVISSDGILTCDNGAVMVDGLSSTAGGTLSYQWIDLATGDTIGTDATLEVITSIDVVLNIVDLNNGCTSTASFFIDEDVEAPAINVNPGSTINCAQPEYALDGSGSTLDPNVTYTYAWTAASNPTFMETTLMVSNIGTPDTYTLLITNTETGCTATDQVIIDGDFDAPTVMTSNNFTITCGDDTAALTGTGSSANGNFSYQWLEGATPYSNSLDTVTTQTGSYTLIVTNEDNGCSSISNAIIIDIDADLPAVMVAPAQTITCNDNGEIILDGSASDGGADIEYQWFLGAVEVGTNAFLTTTDPGDYTFIVNNTATGCSDQVSFTVDADQTPPVAQAGAGGTLICGQDDYELDAVAAGSSDGADFTYIWFDAAGNQVGTGLVFAATAPGDFVVEVTNMVNGCTATSNATQVVADSNSPVLLMDPSADGLNCDIQTLTYDASSSTVNPNSSGTLNYEWTDALGNVLGNTPTIDVSDTNPVTLTITDAANNCSVSASYVAPQDIESPTANAGPVQTLFCGTDNVTLDGGGSTANGALFSYTWTDPNTDPAGTTATIEATFSGTYTLLITNTENGCTATSTVLVDQDNNVPTAIVDFAGMLNCNVDEITVDGSASTTTSGSTVEYAWSNNTSNSSVATFDAPGTYTLTITDAANNCTATQSFTIEEDEVAPIADIQALTSSILSCNEESLVFNGSASNINMNPNGGTLTYEWSLGGTVVSTGSTDQIEIDEDGSLVLVVTNINNGCTATALMNIELDEDVPLAGIATTPAPLTCATDEVTIVATGSTGPEYTYLWTGPGTIVDETTLTPTVSTAGMFTLVVTNTTNGCDASITAQVDGDFDAPNAFANAQDQFDCVTDEVTLDGTGSATGSTISYSWTTATGVIASGANTFNPIVSAPGDYILEVIDNANGCTSTAIVTVTANTDVPTIAGFQAIDPNCFGENNGSITLDNVIGGQLPYLYSIDGGAFAPISQFSFLGAGEYDIVVEDANGCSTSQSITITDPQELLVELGDDDLVELGDEYQLSAQIVGAYDTIIWSVNCPDSLCADQPEFSVTPLNTVSYSVTVIDGNGCITTDQITLNVEKDREVFIPNAFTPNGDGNNDRFWVFPGQEVAKVHEFRVFNRWGEQVFGVSNFDPFVQDDENGWDGTLNNKKMNPAVFVYYVDIEYIDGRREVLKGDVALRR